MVVDAGLELVDPAAELLERLDHRLDPLRPQTQFLDQAHCPAAAAAQPPPRGAALGRRPRAARGQVVVVLVALQKRFQGPQIRGQTAQNLVLLQLVGHRDLNRAIKRQLALVDPPQDLDGQLHDVVAGKHVAAELGAGLFDLPRQGHFFTPRQQRDLAHLRQIHAHRVVGPGFVLVHAFQQAVDIDVQVEFVQLDDEVGHVPNQIVVRIFEPGNGVIGQIVDHFIRARSCVVIQVVQQCVVQLQFSSIKQSRTKLSPNLTLCHKSRPKATKFYHCFPLMIRSAGHLARDSIYEENRCARKSFPIAPNFSNRHGG